MAELFSRMVDFLAVLLHTSFLLRLLISAASLFASLELNI